MKKTIPVKKEKITIRRVSTDCLCLTDLVIRIKEKAPLGLKRNYGCDDLKGLVEG